MSGGHNFPATGIGRRTKESVLTELNTVLSVRAEKIRQRLVEERIDGTEEFLASTDIDHLANEDMAPKSKTEDDMADGDQNMNATQSIKSPSFIPVSKARLRRRQKSLSGNSNCHKGKTAGAAQVKTGSNSSNINIKNYKPGYNWNRGGRVKELRIRCLARKFLRMWRLKTFGRVPLSIAVQHHDVRLTQKMFCAWHDYWWTIVKEWRLAVRAECHMRFKLGLTMFLRWKEFVARRRELKCQAAEADQLYVRQVQGRVFQAWILYVLEQRKQKILMSRAVKCNNVFVIRFAWKLWLHQKELSEHRQEQETLALQFWSYRLQAQQWLIWKCAWQERCKDTQRLKDAAVYRNTVLASACLKRWTLYVRYRKVKHAHSEFASRVWCANQKLHCFNHWFQQWHLRRSIQQHRLKIETHSVQFRQRWVLWRWQQYVESCQQENNSFTLAKQHHERRLVRVCLDALRLNVINSHIKVMRQHLVQKLRHTQLQRQAWKIWCDALVQKEEACLAPKTEKALKHYSDKLLKFGFNTLLSYAFWRQQRKKSYAMADAHFYLRSLPKYFFHMKVFVHIEKNCRENAQNAIEFRRETVFNKVFFTWKQAAKQQQDDRMMERMALLHRESVITQSSFTLWRQRLEDMVLVEGKMEEAKTHYLCSLCMKVLSSWRQHVALQNMQVVNKTQASCHHIKMKLTLSFSKWKKMHQEHVAQGALWRKAQTHHTLKLTKICMSQWKEFVQKGHHFKALAETKWQTCNEKLLRDVLKEWLETATRLAADRRKEPAACVHHNRALLHKSVREWHRYAAIKVYRRSQTQELLAEASEHLKQIKLSLCWQKWLKRKSESEAAGQLMKKAEEHHSRIIQQKIIQAWKMYARICLKKRLLARQSQWFHDVRLTAKFYLTWKDNLVAAVQEHEKTNLALWQWSLVLQAKVMAAWQRYTSFRREKQARMQTAASCYRSNLVRVACCQWLATADSLSHFRSRMAAQHQAQAVVDSFNLAHRIAIHWKLWTRARAGARESKGFKRGAQQDAKTDCASVNFAFPPSVSSQRLDTGLVSSQVPIATQLYSNTVGEHKPLHSSLPPRPKQALASPSKSEQMHPTWSPTSFPVADPRYRPPPKRPAFLMESLKRAGLFAESFESSSGDTTRPDTALSERGSSPALSDLGNNEFLVQQRCKGEMRQTDTTDQSLSAAIMSGSTSLGIGEGDAVKPLHLCNSEDTTDQSGTCGGGGNTLTGSSSTTHSPHAYTPSTQRSQFSGNPLLYSSPVSDTNTARETWRSDIATRPLPPANDKLKKAERSVGAGGFSSRTVPGVTEGIDTASREEDRDRDVEVLLRGNLEGDMIPSNYKQSKRQYQQNEHDGSYEEKERAQRESSGKNCIVLLKPEYFMQKPPTTAVPSSHYKVVVKDQTSEMPQPKKSVLKHTPRAFANQPTDPTSGLPPMAEMKSTSTSPAEIISNTEHTMGRTPRDHMTQASPRRTIPQGILHNKISDSDGDASPLNTARSRGTVTFASPKSPTPEEELINIRDRLRHFHDQKQQLKSLRKQYRQLSDWLMEQQSSQQADDEDDDSRNATEELNMLRLEVSELQSLVDSQRPVCERLVIRAKALAQDLG